MAKLTKSNEKLFVELTALFHALIRAKHKNDRAEFERIIEDIKEKTNDEK